MARRTVVPSSPHLQTKLQEPGQERKRETQFPQTPTNQTPPRHPINSTKSPASIACWARALQNTSRTTPDQLLISYAVSFRMVGTATVPCLTHHPREPCIYIWRCVFTVPHFAPILSVTCSLECPETIVDLHISSAFSALRCLFTVDLHIPACLLPLDTPYDYSWSLGSHSPLFSLASLFSLAIY